MNRRTDASIITCAERLGVSYNHLYRVLRRERKSDGLLFTVIDKFPHLLRRLPTEIVDRNLSDYFEFVKDWKWSRKKQRYVRKED